MIACYIPTEIKEKLYDCSDGRNGAKDPSWSRRKTEIFTDQELDRLGIIGEYAAADVLGVNLDWSVTTHGDNGHDLVLPNGWTAAVKFNHRYKGFLMIEGRDGDTDDELVDLTTDVLILTHSFCEPKENICRCHDRLLTADYPSTIIIAGWISRSEFMRLKSERDWGAGLRHFVVVEDLRNIGELIALSKLKIPAHLVGGTRPKRRNPSRNGYGRLARPATTPLNHLGA